MKHFARRRFWSSVRDHEPVEWTPEELQLVADALVDDPELAALFEAETSAVDALRTADEGYDPGEAFNTKVLRRWRVEQNRGIAYWSPALIGAGVAALAILAALQMISRAERFQSLDMRGSAAYNREAKSIDFASIKSRPIEPIER